STPPRRIPAPRGELHVVLVAICSPVSGGTRMIRLLSTRGVGAALFALSSMVALPVRAAETPTPAAAGAPVATPGTAGSEAPLTLQLTGEPALDLLPR